MSRPVDQLNDVRVARLVLAKLTTAGLVNRSTLATAPGIRSSADPTGLTGLNPAELILDYTNGKLFIAGTDGVPVEVQQVGAGAAQADLIFDAATELTIASGAITVTQGAHTVDTESDAASDNLDTISGLTAEELVVLRPASAARTVVLRDASVGSGNVYTPGQQSISLAEATDFALVYSDGTNAVVVAYRTQALGGGGLGAALASVANGQGAALVGVEDAAGDFTGATVEAVLAELGAVRTLRATGTIPAGNGAGNVGDLNSTPVSLVAAPGAGLYVHVLAVHWFLDYASAAYDGTKTGNLMVKYTDGSGDELTGQVAETGFMDQTADVHAQVHGVDYVPLANAAVVAHADNDWFSAAGDSPVKYEVLYQVRPIDPTA